MPTRALFQQIKKTFRCLAKYPHRPLFWPSNIPLDSTTTLTRTVSVDKTVTAEMSNHLTLHADGSENKSVYDPRAIGCTVTTLMGIAVGWKVMTLSQQQDSSTFSEMQTYFNATRSGGIACQIQNFIGDKVIGPIPIYEDNQPTINIVESDNPTNKSRHFATYGAVSRDHLVQGMSKPVKNSTHLQYADIGAKYTPRVTREHHHNNMIGLPHYPKPGTEHYKLLQLDKLNCSFRDGIDINDIPQA